MNKPEIKVRVRAIVIKNHKLLVVVNDRDGFCYLPGGKLEPFETIVESIKREIQEELGITTTFDFTKIGYIREFHDHKRNIHNIEFFVIGDLNKFEELEGIHDPGHYGNDHFSWIDLTKLPSNLKPNWLINKLRPDFDSGFIKQPEYLQETD